MSKWKCGICNSEFENCHAKGFDSIIYCPLCYYKELYKREKKEIEQLRTELNSKNNIINELESYLEQQWLEWKDDYNDEIVAMAKEDKAVLYKLKELKENNNDNIL